jgi:16S rRNA (cytidine1402-2'-O)-methyltransferase
LKWGLPRESIERFIVFNEHTQDKLFPEIIQELKKGKNAILMSDGGLPAFCDPGQTLVNACHENKIKVTSTPFPNSIALAVALSGFPHHEFHFAGFLPAQADERRNSIEKLARPELGALILMDTPYRLQTLMKEISVSKLKKRKIFVGTSLNTPEERLFRGSISTVLREMDSLNKVEFVIILNAD